MIAGKASGLSVPLSLVVTIEKVNLLLHPIVDIGVRSSGIPSAQWVSFRNPLLPQITVAPAELPAMLAHPPVASGAAKIDQWVNAMLKETILPMGQSGKIKLTVSGVVSFAQFPILLLPPSEYSPEMASQVAAAIRSFMVAQGLTDLTKLSFGVELFQDGINNPSPVVEFSALDLDWSRVSGK